MRATRALSLLVAGLLMGIVVTGPAGAHFRTNIGHLARHLTGFFYTETEEPS